MLTLMRRSIMFMGCAVVLLVMSVVICMVLTLMLLAKPAQAESLLEDAYESVLLIASQPEATSSPRREGLFDPARWRLPTLPATCRPRLAGDPTGVDGLRVDDRLTI